MDVLHFLPLTSYYLLLSTYYFAYRLGRPVTAPTVEAGRQIAGATGGVRVEATPHPSSALRGTADATFPPRGKALRTADGRPYGKSVSQSIFKEDFP